MLSEKKFNQIAKLMDDKGLSALEACKRLNANVDQFYHLRRKKTSIEVMPVANQPKKVIRNTSERKLALIIGLPEDIASLVAKL